MFSLIGFFPDINVSGQTIRSNPEDSEILRNFIPFTTFYHIHTGLETVDTLLHADYNRTLLHAGNESVIQMGNIPQLTPIDPGNLPKIVPY